MSINYTKKIKSGENKFQCVPHKDKKKHRTIQVIDAGNPWFFPNLGINNLVLTIESMQQNILNRQKEWHLTNENCLSTYKIVFLSL